MASVAGCDWALRTAHTSATAQQSSLITIIKRQVKHRLPIVARCDSATT